MKRLVIILVAVLGLLAGLDFGARLFAQSQAARVFATQFHVGGDVSVRLGGWPFLTQVASNTLDEVQLDAAQVPLQRGPLKVTVASVHVTAQDVAPARDPARASARYASALVTATWQQLSDAARIPMKGLPDGRVQATTRVAILGADLDVTVIGRPYLDAARQRFTIIDSSATIANLEVPTDILENAVNQISSRVKLPEIDGLRLAALDASEDNVTFNLVGNDVQLSR